MTLRFDARGGVGGFRESALFRGCRCCPAPPGKDEAQGPQGSQVSVGARTRAGLIFEGNDSGERSNVLRPLRLRCGPCAPPLPNVHTAGCRESTRSYMASIFSAASEAARIYIG